LQGSIISAVFGPQLQYAQYPEYKKSSTFPGDSGHPETLHRHIVDLN